MGKVHKVISKVFHLQPDMYYTLHDQSLSELYYNWELSYPKLVSVTLYTSIKNLQNKHLTLDPDPYSIIRGKANCSLSKCTAILQTNTPVPNKS